ncbi:hypothetical protein EV368DRAFT_78414 [Lentinula lateritia]|uniref:Uncharacterized protein n=1 Tax=Lentinula aff. lateritia TaxID=2804960 RepID=A0ACC1TQG9_9AGAR|nr:hypothetical protein F5876DRAFT_80228 [Lentinula aff. lateritia]KAJ3856753.1 hypothetical protein EV368DRAFT_78414 [Lentinula lateritia]
MSSDSARSPSRTPSPLLPPLTALGEVPSPDSESDGEVEQDQLAFTLESLSRPQLQLFKMVFNTGKPLSGYCQDDPLWLLLAEVASPCTNCAKTPGKCKVLAELPSMHQPFLQEDFRRLLELHGTLMHQSTWGIPLSVWREYDTALHAHTSSTSTLLELNMLDERDTAEADQQELQKFLALQQGETAIAAKHKRDRSPLPVAGPSRKKVWSVAPKKCSRHKSPVAEATPDSPLRIRLVVPPGRPVVASSSLPVRPRASPSLMEVLHRDLPMQGPSDLVRLAAVAEAHSGLVQQAVSSSPAQRPIKGAGQDLLSSEMPPTPHSTLVPRTLASHPYRAENQRLAARVRLLESQLADSQWENSSLTSALQDTSHALESRQREVEQLRTSSREFLQHQAEYRRIIDQFNTLDRALSGPPDQSLPERFQKVEEEHQLAKKDQDDAAGKLSTSSCKVSELTTALLYQHGIVDEANALSTRQHVGLEELQEEVHRTCGCAAFVERMIKEYPDEGYYEVVLPPLSQLEGDLVKVWADLRCVATLAHRLYCSDPATMLHHHNCYIGAIIEVVIAFLRHALESEDPDVVVHNFRLALDYMQSARGIHGDLHMRSISSIQWFFNNTVDQDKGLYTLMLEHSRFDSDGPFLTAAQHAGFANPPPDSLKPPLHRHMLALSTALPHREGTGQWDDIVPAIPSDDQLTLDWEQLMLRYIHHITDTPLSAPDMPIPMSLVGPGGESSGGVGVGAEQSFDAGVAPMVEPRSVGSPIQTPLFLPEQESPTSPSPPPPSPSLPPLFGSVAPLSIDLTGDDDELYDAGEVHVGQVFETGEMKAVPSEGILKNEPL